MYDSIDGPKRPVVRVEVKLQGEARDGKGDTQRPAPT